MYDYNEDKIRLDTFQFDKIQGYWFLKLSRLRDNNIPKKAHTNKPSEGIPLDEDEYISEDCYAIYDKNLGVLMLQQNIHSLSKLGVTAYFNKVLNDKKRLVLLKPILSPNMVERLKKSESIRCITIGLADINNKSLDSEVKSPIKQIFDEAQTFGEQGTKVNLDFKISVGTPGKGKLGGTSAKSAIEDILNNISKFTKAVINVKEKADEKVIPINLLEELLHDNINVKLENRRAIEQSDLEADMIKHFNNKKGIIGDVISEEYKI